jgi:hypothetical protein
MRFFCATLHINNLEMRLRPAGSRPTVYPVSFFSRGFAISRSTGWDRAAFCLVCLFGKFRAGHVTYSRLLYTRCRVQHCTAQTRHRLTAVLLELQVFWDVALCRWVQRHYLRIVGNHSPDDTVSHPKSQEASNTMASESTACNLQFNWLLPFPR